MPRHAAITHTAALLLTAAAAHAGTPGCPDAGVVLSETKISETSGGFGGTLDASDRFGSDMAPLGDLDGDGVNDIAVNAYRDDDGGLDRGAVWILFMNANGTVKSEQKISDLVGGFTGTLDNNDVFGQRLKAIGDLDGDGVVDLAVCAAEDDDGGVDRGALWLLFLNTDGTVKSHAKVSATSGGFTGALDNSDFFGGDVDVLGDLDGDGVTDLAVGAYGDDDGGTNTGAIWVLFMNTDGTVKAHQKISQATGGFTGVFGAGLSIGLNLSAVPDLDGDGVADLAAGSPNDNDGGLGRGAIWILFLNPNGTVKSHQKISDISGGFDGVLDNGDAFGTGGFVGDIDGDGVADFAAGAISDDDGGADRGAVWLLFLNPNGTVKAHQKISATEGGFQGALDNGDAFGTATSNVGDLNQDGNPELAVGVFFDDDGNLDAGALWILSVQDCSNEPVITAQPQGVALPPGGGAVTLTVAATGDAPLFYEWRKDNVALSDGGGVSGSGSPTLMLAAMNDDIGVYKCVVSNDLGEAISAEAVIAVRQSCAGDFDGDFDIDFADLNRILGAYNTICP